MRMPDLSCVVSEINTMNHIINIQSLANQNCLPAGEMIIKTAAAIIIISS